MFIPTKNTYASFLTTNNTRFALSRGTKLSLQLAGKRSGDFRLVSSQSDAVQNPIDRSYFHFLLTKNLLLLNRTKLVHGVSHSAFLSSLFLLALCPLFSRLWHLVNCQKAWAFRNHTKQIEILPFPSQHKISVKSYLETNTLSDADIWHHINCQQRLPEEDS